MSVKSVPAALAALTVVALLLAVWHRPALHAAASRLWGDLAAEVRPAADPAATVRKCGGAAGVAYTDAACPSGTRELALDGGGLTVLPSPAARLSPVQSSAGKASAPNVRQLLLSADGADLKAQRIDQVIGR